MSYTLNSTAIRSPSKMTVSNSTQYAANRTLSGANTRDYFGSNKRVWSLQYDNLNITDFNVINTIYLAYLSTETVVPFVISETNYSVLSTTVHVDFVNREFSIPGSDYLSNNTLILTEA